MRIVLFGAGAMSCLFAARLAPVADVVLVDAWAEAVAAIRERGIRLEDEGNLRTVQVEADILGSRAAPADFGIVLVKAWQTEQVARHLEDYLKPGAIAVSLQNGLGNLELLGSRVSPGATSEGATLLGPGHVRAGGSGPTHVVAPEWVVRLMRDAGFDCRRCSRAEAEGLLWGKLAISCGINALTALLRVPNGGLLENPDAGDLMVRAACECAAVACAKGIRLPFGDSAESVKEVARRTAHNRSSMLQDILRGAPTECDAINGAVAKEGARAGVPVPVNEALWRLVRAAVHFSGSGS